MQIPEKALAFDFGGGASRSKAFPISARERASARSVLARVPRASANRRAWNGFTLTRGKIRLQRQLEWPVIGPGCLIDDSGDVAPIQPFPEVPIPSLAVLELRCAFGFEIERVEVGFGMSTPMLCFVIFAISVDRHAKLTLILG
jgi:hypothetical protein